MKQQQIYIKHLTEHRTQQAETNKQQKLKQIIVFIYLPYKLKKKNIYKQLCMMYRSN